MLIYILLSNSRRSNDPCVILVVLILGETFIAWYNAPEIENPTIHKKYEETKRTKVASWKL